MLGKVGGFEAFAGSLAIGWPACDVVDVPAGDALARHDADLENDVDLDSLGVWTVHWRQALGWSVR